MEDNDTTRFYDSRWPSVASSEFDDQSSQHKPPSILKLPLPRWGKRPWPIVPFVLLYWTFFVPHRTQLFRVNTPLRRQRPTLKNTILRLLNLFLWGGVLFLLGRYSNGFYNLISSLLPISLEALANALNFAWAGPMFAVPALLAGAGIVFAALGQFVVRYGFDLLIEPERYIEQQHFKQWPRLKPFMLRALNAVMWGALLAAVVTILLFLSPARASMWLGAIIGGVIGLVLAALGQLKAYMSDWQASQGSSPPIVRNGTEQLDGFNRIQEGLLRFLFAPGAVMLPTPIRQAVRVLNMMAWGGIVYLLTRLFLVNDAITMLNPVAIFIAGVVLSGLAQLIDYAIDWRSSKYSSITGGHHGYMNSQGRTQWALPFVNVAIFFHGLMLNPVLYSQARQLSPIKMTAFFVAHTLIWGSIVALGAVELLGNTFGSTGAGIIFGLLGSVVAAGIQYWRYRAPPPSVDDIFAPKTVRHNEIFGDARTQDMDLYIRWGKNAHHNLVESVAKSLCCPFWNKRERDLESERVTDMAGLDESRPGTPTPDQL